MNGVYLLQVPAGAARIAFSFVGYTTRTEAITLVAGERRDLNIKLALGNAQLETVVIGGGRYEQRIGEVAIAERAAADIILNKNVVSLEQALDQCPAW